MKTVINRIDTKTEPYTITGTITHAHMLLAWSKSIQKMKTETLRSLQLRRLLYIH